MLTHNARSDAVRSTLQCGHHICRSQSSVTVNGVSRPRLVGGARKNVVASAASGSSDDKASETAVQVKERDEDPSLFFEPLLRSFLIGLGAGVLCESAHVTLKFLSLAANMGYHQILSSWPMIMDQFEPNIIMDNIAASGIWMLLYVVEAFAIMSVLQQHPNETQEQLAQSVKALVTLPKKLLPLKLTIFKALLLSVGRMGRPSLAGASTGPGAFAGSAIASPPPTALAFRDGPETPVITPPSVFTKPPKVVEDLVVPPADADLEDLLKKEPVVQLPPPTVIPPKARLQPKRQPSLKPGELDPRANQWALRQKELQQRQSYLKNFWYAAALSQNVKDKPVKVEIMGMNLVLFRDSTGQVVCLSDTCVHRGAPLSKGWVDKINGHDCVVCPYHGWAFDKDGRLQDVPAESRKGMWPNRPLIPSFPVVEKGGFIWMFYGSKDLPEDERPPIPFVPELEDPNWQAAYGEIEFDCNHFSVFENAIDMAHIHYLHNDSFGNQEKPNVDDMTVETGAFDVTSTFKIRNKPANALWNWTAVPEVLVTAKAFLPSTSMISFTLAHNVSMITFVNTVPISATRSVNRFCLVRNFANWEGFDAFAQRSMMHILGQDKEMVEQLRPDLLMREVSVRADLPQIAFRKLRQSFVDLGYAVPPETNGDVFRGDL